MPSQMRLKLSVQQAKRKEDMRAKCVLAEFWGEEQLKPSFRVKKHALVWSNKALTWNKIKVIIQRSMAGHVRARLGCPCNFPFCR